MATIAKLMVEVGLEDGAFQRGLTNTRNSLDKWGNSFRGWGTNLTAGVTTPILGAGGAMTKWAADLEQSHGATAQLWDENESRIFKWAKGADRSMGMTENAALQNVNRFNAMFKTLGEGEDVVFDMSTGFTQLSADLSAMWGGSPTEAADALTSALRGNYEGLDKYNINITEAMVSQEAMNVAMADGRTEITEADKVQARYNLIMAQTTDSQGQFARETDTTAGKLAVMKARLQNAATTFGRLLLPYVNKAVDLFSRFVTWIEKLNDTQRKWILILAAVAAAIGPVLLVVGMLLPGLSALLAVIGFLVSPIGLVVLAVAALAAGLIYAYTHFEGFRNVVNAVASTIKDVAIAAFQGLIAILSSLKAAFDAGGFSGVLQAMGEMLLSGLSNLSNLAYQGIQWLADQFTAGVSSLWNAASTWFQGLWDGATSKWNEFTGWAAGLAGEAATWIGDTTASLWQKGVDLFIGLGNGAQVQWENLRTWLAARAASAMSAVGDVTATLWQKGVDLFIGLGNGAMIQWDNLRTWLANRGAMAASAVGNLISTLWQKGVELFIGMGNGVQAQWGNLKAWLTDMPSRLTSSIGALSSTLWNAGWDLMWGLAEGIYSGASSLVSAAIGSVADMIPGWIKGPLGINSPSRVFMQIGREIPAGLAIGIGQGTPAVENAMRGLVGVSGFDSAHHSGGANGVAPVINVYQVTPQALVELMSDAKAGSVFAKQFSNELGMMEGVA